MPRAIALSQQGGGVIRLSGYHAVPPGRDASNGVEHLSDDEGYPVFCSLNPSLMDMTLGLNSML